MTTPAVAARNTRTGLQRMQVGLSLDEAPRSKSRSAALGSNSSQSCLFCFSSQHEPRCPRASTISGGGDGQRRQVNWPLLASFHCLGSRESCDPPPHYPADPGQALVHLTAKSPRPSHSLAERGWVAIVLTTTAHVQLMTQLLQSAVQWRHSCFLFGTSCRCLAVRLVLTLRPTEQELGRLGTMAVQAAGRIAYRRRPQPSAM